MDTNIKISLLPDDELRSIVTDLMKKTLVSLDQKPSQEFFDTWRNEFISFIKNKYGNYRIGNVVNYFDQIKSGAIDIEKINSRNLISNFKKVFFKKAEEQDNQSWRTSWNIRSDEEKRFDKLGSDVFHYRNNNLQHKSNHTWEETVKMMMSGEIKPVAVKEPITKRLKYKS